MEFQFEKSNISVSHVTKRAVAGLVKHVSWNDKWGTVVG